MEQENPLASPVPFVVSGDKLKNRALEAPNSSHLPHNDAHSFESAKKKKEGESKITRRGLGSMKKVATGQNKKRGSREKRDSPYPQSSTKLKKKKKKKNEDSAEG